MQTIEEYQRYTRQLEGEVMVNFAKPNDRMLTRSFVVCEKCACGLLQKFIESEPINKRCNNG